MHFPRRWSVILRSMSVTFPVTACLEDIDPRVGQSFGRQWGLSATCPQGSRRMCSFRAKFASSGPFTLDPLLPARLSLSLNPQGLLGVCLCERGWVRSFQERHLGQ